jgi:hypothetical protein
LLLDHQAAFLKVGGFHAGGGRHDADRIAGTERGWK